MPLYQWSTTPNNNANASTGVNWAEGQLPSTVNNSARQMMADVAQWYAAPEWLNYGLTPTYVSATQFTVAGNQTATYQVNRRVRAFVTAGTVYGTITASAYTTLTTVTVTWDSGALDSGVSEVDVHIVDGNFLIPASNTTFDGGALPAFFLSKNNRVVDSIAALRALSHLTYTRAFGTGYYSPGDGGGGPYYYDSTDTTSGAYFTGSIAPITAPAAPTLTSSAGGTLAATTYYVKTTYVTAAGETLPSAESSLAVAANNVLGVTSPAAQSGATGYNVYVSTSTGTETKQNSAPIAIGTNWTEPTSGLIAGAALTSSGTAGSLLTVSAVTNGTLAIGQQVNGAGSVAQCYIAGQVSGTGGIGTYTVTGAQTVASQTLTADNGGTIVVAFDGGRWKLANTANGVSVKQFGAKGDGATDDSSAIQAALTALAGKTTYFPAGIYKVATAITLPNNTTMIGAGMFDATIAPVTANMVLFSQTNGSSTIANIYISDVGIDASATGSAISGVTGIRFVLCQNTELQRIRFAGLNYDFDIDRGRFHNLRNLRSTGTSTAQAGRYRVYSSSDTDYVYQVTLDGYFLENIGNGTQGPVAYHRRVVGSQFSHINANDLNAGNGAPADFIIVENDCQGVKFFANMCAGAARGVVCQTGSGVNVAPSFLTFVDNDFDQSHTYAVHLVSGNWIEIIGGNSTASGVNTTSPAYNIGAVNHLSISGVVVQGYSGTNGTGFNVNSAIDFTIANSIIESCNIGIGIVGTTQGLIVNNGAKNVITAIAGSYQQAGIWIKDNPGINPILAVAAPAFPASGSTYTNNTGVSLRVTWAGGSVTGLAINGIAGFLSMNTFVLNPGETVSFTYTGSPGWAFAPM
jgi:hypothetical protein